MNDSNSPDPIHVGLLVLRVGIGVIMMCHGIPKLLAGPELWVKLGQAMGVFGIHFMPAFWGFMAGAAEGFGGLFLALGLCVRISASFLTFTMFIATSMHIIAKGDGFDKYSHALSLATVFLSFIFMGGGRYSLGAKVPPLADRWFQ